MNDIDEILFRDISKLPEYIGELSATQQRCVRAALATVFEPELNRFIKATIKDIRELPPISSHRAPTIKECALPSEVLRDFVETGNNILQIMEEAQRLLTEEGFRDLESLFLEYGSTLMRLEVVDKGVLNDPDLKPMAKERLRKIKEAFLLVDTAFPEMQGLREQAEGEMLLQQMVRELKPKKGEMIH